MTKTNAESFSIGRLFLQRAWLTESRGTFKANDVESGTSKQNNSEKACTLTRDGVMFGALLNSSAKTGSAAAFCEICCCKELDTNPFYKLEICSHTFCSSCLINYLKNEISESRTDIACPQCSSAIHPNNIYHLLRDNPDLIAKYEDFMIRRYLIADPDSRWCPAPNCSYAVIANGCASCPELKCEKPNCGKSFCYHCKAEWHPDQTCDSARTARENHLHSSTLIYSCNNSRRDDIKPCPRCQILIVKMNDGSCNHMVCSVCGAEFCWLCMKEVSDLHYFSPSGCTFWGKKPWSRKKKIVWQIGTLIGAPVGIALLASVAIPSMVIGIPIWVGRKLLNRYKAKSKHQRNISVSLGVIASVIVSPVLAGLAIAIGVPILLFYVYGVVPVSLCRASCGNSSKFEDYKLELNVDDKKSNQNIEDKIIEGYPGIAEKNVDSLTGRSMVTEESNNATNKNSQNFLRGSTTAILESVQNIIVEDSENMLVQRANPLDRNTELSETINVTLE